MPKLSLICFVLIMVLMCALEGNARVKGLCSNCHTMHYSQDGSTFRNGGRADLTGICW